MAAPELNLNDDPGRWFTEPLRHLGDEDPALRGILGPAAERIEPIQGVTAQFLENAADYHARYSNIAHFRVLLDDALARLEPPIEPRTILDIGSGSGNSVIPLLDRFPNAFVVASDISPQLLALLRDQLAGQPEYARRFALVCIDAGDARYRHGAFDLAVGAAILHHVMDPGRVLQSSQAALRPGGAAIFFEPFEMGHAVLHLAYRNIIAEAQRRGDNARGIEMLRRLEADYTARGSERNAQQLMALDDKWMFTRGFFESAAEHGNWSECVVYAIHGDESPLTEETRVNLRLGMDVEESALPPWVWERLSEYERSFSRAARRELIFEGAVVMRTSPAMRIDHASRSGWWFNPGEPGRGFFVEIRDDVASIVCCGYDDDGRPVWHAAGPARLERGTMTATAAPFQFPDAPATVAARVPDVGSNFRLSFTSPGEARVQWGSAEILLQPQHAGSPGWTAASTNWLGGWWMEDAEHPSLAAVVEYLDHRVFVALLSANEWCLTIATRRRAAFYAGQWLRFSGGQTLDGPYRPPGDPEPLGDARLSWIETGQLVIEMPGGVHKTLRRARP
jgi:SAM-dependent methyltransferase